MKVLLLDRIAKLGDLGDEVTVKNGYARNYLLPQQLALRATDENRQRFEQMREDLHKKVVERLEGAERRAAQLEDKTLTILMRVADGGRLYGSVGPVEICTELEKQGIEIHKSEVRMPYGVIREVGEYEVQVHIHAEIERSITVFVEQE
ncbi:MAG: 50S ribosomal protein L9 [Gammaproteobacteria bacterium]|nr:50S ribosomal protein L9 [Gammaproteobacteria bacterium]